MKSLGRTRDIVPRLGRSIVRGTRDVARPRGLLPGSRGVAWRLWRGRPRAVSRVVMRDRPSGFGLWPRLQTDGHSFGRARNIVPRPAGLRGWALFLDRAVWTVFTLLV
ncbi:unnamed protein product [Microthlaspi erraticum]|uniref:Uncharacterized protein n=1 Tax=Microthlaspi erraticum TaxID=1685480 RepID=A0A6D2K8K1_9BRAS|nr:unnamed protein product [Microthlaspi erraticum]